MKQFEVLQWAFSFLKKHNREEHVAELLLQHITNQHNTTFYANMHKQIDKTTKEKFIEQIKLHAKTGIPIQHLIGKAHFFGREFVVSEDVLIPRFETEELVLHVINEIKKINLDEQLTIVDLGTGSGIIAITLSLEAANVAVYATDISNRALQIAEKNASHHKANVTFLQGDFLQPIIENDINPHIIVSNPPYIAQSERHLLSDTVWKFDPHLALFADNNGLQSYETIIKQTTQLRPPFKGRIIFEIGYRQKESVSSIIKQTFPQSRINILQDINGKDRIVSAKIVNESKYE